MAATGQGMAGEAARALLAVAATLRGLTHVEVRCSADNAPSAAIPRRLGFQLAAVEADLQIWSKPLADITELSDHGHR